MRNPLAAWRAGVRWPLAILGLVAALVVAVLVCESIGWPFLVSPVQGWLARTLDRRVEFNDEAGGQSGVRVGLLGSVRITAQRDRDRRAGVEQGAAHAAGARRPPAPRLPRPLARLARRAPAHRGPSRRASSTPPSSAVPTAGPRGSSASAQASACRRKARPRCRPSPSCMSARAVLPTSTSVLAGRRSTPISR